MQLNGQSIFVDGNSTQQSSDPTANVCAGCNQPIKDKYLLKAVERVWHEDCLKCSCCDCRLGEVGSTLFVKANSLLCKQDYLRLFGMPGQCSACLQPIPAFEMIMRAREHVYHMECFACQHCKLRFCVGDRFYLFGSKIVCEDHHHQGPREGNSDSMLCNQDNKEKDRNDTLHHHNNNKQDIDLKTSISSHLDGIIKS